LLQNILLISLSIKALNHLRVDHRASSIDSNYKRVLCEKINEIVEQKKIVFSFKLKVLCWKKKFHEKAVLLDENFILKRFFSKELNFSACNGFV
jgi:hypothetical protein